jgi:hypothetical protein
MPNGFSRHGVHQCSRRSPLHTVELYTVNNQLVQDSATWKLSLGHIQAAAVVAWPVEQLEADTFGECWRIRTDVKKDRFGRVLSFSFPLRDS